MEINKQIDYLRGLISQYQIRATQLKEVNSPAKVVSLNKELFLLKEKIKFNFDSLENKVHKKAYKIWFTQGEVMYKKVFIYPPSEIEKYFEALNAVSGDKGKFKMVYWEVLESNHIKEVTDEKEKEALKSKIESRGKRDNI